MKLKYGGGGKPTLFCNLCYTFCLKIPSNVVSSNLGDVCHLESF